jgi:hypothetical protein
MHSSIDYIRNTDIAYPRVLRDAGGEEPRSDADLDALPDTVVSGGTLFDFSNAPEPQVRYALSLATTFAQRVVAADETANDPDSWLAVYQTSLGRLGFNVDGTSVVRSRLRKVDVLLHRAIIPFLTIALGGVAVGPAMIALLEGLGKMEKNTPWIRVFHRDSRRFDVHEMHFASAAQKGPDTQVRNVVVRFNVQTDVVQFLFFRVTQDTAEFESQTTSWVANNGLLLANASAIESKLEEMTKSYIFAAKLK